MKKRKSFVDPFWKLRRKAKKGWEKPKPQLSPFFVHPLFKLSDLIELELKREAVAYLKGKYR